MTKFSDQLYSDLMREHADTLRRTELPAAPRGHLTGTRAAWMAGGAGTLAVGITASLAAFGGSGSAAYAVTTHPDGTVTVGISQLSGITGANTTLTSLGDRVVVVPAKAGCPSLDSLPHPAPKAGTISVSVSGIVRSDGTMTVDAHGVPKGDLMVLAVDDTGHGIAMASAGLTTGPAPSCVSLPAGFPEIPAPGGSGSRHGGGQGSFSVSGSTGGSGTNGSVPASDPVTSSNVG
jgi:hypothetical protein